MWYISNHQKRFSSVGRDKETREITMIHFFKSMMRWGFKEKFEISRILKNPFQLPKAASDPRLNSVILDRRMPSESSLRWGGWLFTKNYTGLLIKLAHPVHWAALSLKVLCSEFLMCGWFPLFYICGEICISLHNDLFYGTHAGIGGCFILQRG